MTLLHTNILKKFQKNDRLTMIVSGCAALSIAFTVGLKTSNDVHPIHLTNADFTSLAGDMNSDGVVTKDDAIRALEIALGYEDMTDRDRNADPNGDMRITVEDVLTILKSLR